MCFLLQKTLFFAKKMVNFSSKRLLDFFCLQFKVNFAIITSGMWETRISRTRDGSGFERLSYRAATDTADRIRLCSRI